MVLNYTELTTSLHDSSILIQFRNCRILRHSAWQDVDLWVENGRIINPEPIFFSEKRTACMQVDCGGLLMVPGYIDIQLNGAFGVDFSSPTNLQESMPVVAKGLLKYGVTAFCPTIISSSRETYKQVIPQIQCTSGDMNGAAVLGLHLEGPFISMSQHGCHPIKHVQPDLGCEVQGLKDMYTHEGLEKTKILTIAPELNNAMITIQKLMQEYDIKVSLGHSAGDLSHGELALKAGASCITHLFNAMNVFHHRDPGLVGLLTSKYVLAGLPLYYGLISDGIHTHDSALRIAYRTDPNGLILITDAMAALGLSDGIHNLGDLSVQVNGYRATLDGKNMLAGSVCSLDECVRHLKKAAHTTSLEAIECATLHPAQFLGIQKERGSLNFGARADFLLLDDHLNVKATFIAGQKVWNA